MRCGRVAWRGPLGGLGKSSCVVEMQDWRERRWGAVWGVRIQRVVIRRGGRGSSRGGFLFGVGRGWCSVYILPCLEGFTCNCEYTVLYCSLSCMSKRSATCTVPFLCHRVQPLNVLRVIPTQLLPLPMSVTQICPALFSPSPLGKEALGTLQSLQALSLIIHADHTKITFSLFPLPSTGTLDGTMNPPPPCASIFHSRIPFIPS